MALLPHALQLSPRTLLAGGLALSSRLLAVGEPITDVNQVSPSPTAAKDVPGGRSGGGGLSGGRGVSTFFDELDTNDNGEIEREEAVDYIGTYRRDCVGYHG